MTGESFDGTLLAAFVVLMSTVGIVAILTVIGNWIGDLVLSLINPPKKRVDQHPEW